MEKLVWHSDGLFLDREHSPVSGSQFSHPRGAAHSITSYVLLSSGLAPSSPMVPISNPSLSGPLDGLRPAPREPSSAISPGASFSSGSLGNDQLPGPFEVDQLLGHLEIGQSLVSPDVCRSTRSRQKLQKLQDYTFYTVWSSPSIFISSTSPLLRLLQVLPCIL